MTTRAAVGKRTLLPIRLFIRTLFRLLRRRGHGLPGLPHLPDAARRRQEGLLPLPQRDHLQPGAANMRVVVRLKYVTFKTNKYSSMYSILF